MKIVSEYLEFQPKPLSNKTENSHSPIKSSVPNACVAYSYRDQKKFTVIVTRPKLDRLVMVIPILAKDDQIGVQGNLIELAKDTSEHCWQSGSGKTAIHAHYAINCRFQVSETDPAVLIQVAPKSAKIKNFMRLELNPAALGHEKFEYFIEQLIAQVFLGQYDGAYLLKQATVTRFDAAVDLVNVRTDELLLAWNKPAGSVLYLSPRGAVETTYVGKAIGQFPCYLYDKRQQMLDAGGVPQYRSAPYARVERRVKTKVQLGHLANAKNALAKATIHNFSTCDRPEPEFRWQMFVDTCRVRGPKKALALLPADLRDQYEPAFEQTAQEWRPKEIWSYWPGEIDSYLSLL